MSQNKYQELFGLLVQKKEKGICIEIPESDLPNIKPALAKLKKQYNEENKNLPPEFATKDLTGNFRYRIQEGDKPTDPNNIVVKITLEEKPPLVFKIIGGD